MKKQKLLLLDDVHALGRKGDIVQVKSGYGRNYLLPKAFAVIADERVQELSEKLKKERAIKATEDKKEAEAIASRFAEFSLEAKVKVDPEGNLYGSVTTLEITDLLKEKGFPIERANVVLARPVKSLGTHKVNIKLKEGVTASFNLEVVSE